MDDGIICVSNKLEVMLLEIKENNYDIIQSIEKTIIKTAKLYDNKIFVLESDNKGNIYKYENKKLILENQKVFNSFKK